MCRSGSYGQQHALVRCLLYALYTEYYDHASRIAAAIDVAVDLAKLEAIGDVGSYHSDPTVGCCVGDFIQITFFVVEWVHVTE